MPLSARNRLAGTVRTVETSGRMAEVTLDLDGGDTVTAIITADSAERLGLGEGDDVEAVIKATEALIEA